MKQRPSAGRWALESRRSEARVTTRGGGKVSGSLFISIVITTHKTRVQGSQFTLLHSPPLKVCFVLEASIEREEKIPAQKKRQPKEDYPKKRRGY